jgi:hypothetical protein
MGSFLAVLTTAALLAMLGAHVALLVRVTRGIGILRALVALVVPPLAPLWGWRAGARLPVYTWLVALLLYTFGVVVIGR